MAWLGEPAGTSEGPTMSSRDIKADFVRAALARGDLLAAYDAIRQGKAQEPGRADLDYLEVLTTTMRSAPWATWTPCR